MNLRRPMPPLPTSYSKMRVRPALRASVLVVPKFTTAMTLDFTHIGAAALALALVRLVFASSHAGPKRMFLNYCIKDILV